MYVCACTCVRVRMVACRVCLFVARLRVLVCVCLECMCVGVYVCVRASSQISDAFLWLEAACDRAYTRAQAAADLLQVILLDCVAFGRTLPLEQR